MGCGEGEGHEFNQHPAASSNFNKAPAAVLRNEKRKMIGVHFVRDLMRPKRGK